MARVDGSFLDNIRNRQELNAFISGSIQLPDDVKTDYKVAVDEIATFLRSNKDYGCGQPRDFPWKFKRVILSGSIDKGTAVRGHADVDLVCFIESSKSAGMTQPIEFLRMRETIIEDITRKFGAYFKWVKEGSRWTGAIKDYPVQDQKSKFIPLYNFHNGYLLNVKLLKASGEECYSLPKEADELFGASDELEPDEGVIDVDIIPGFDLYAFLDQTPGKQEGKKVFSYIGKQEHPMKFADLFSASLAEMQRNFIKDRLNKGNLNNVKKLILLVKYWFKKEVKSRYNRVRFPSYLLELLCLHVFKTYFQDGKYDILKWFHKVFDVMERRDELTCVWTDNYDEQDVPWQVMEQRPLITDPANPFNNVAGGVAQWPEVSACAKVFKRELERKFPELRGAQISRETSVEAVPRLEAELDSSLDVCDDGPMAGISPVPKRMRRELRRDSSSSPSATSATATASFSLGRA